MRRDRGQRLIEAFVLRRCVGKSPEKSMGMGRISERAGQNLCVYSHCSRVLRCGGNLNTTHDTTLRSRHERRERQVG